MIYTIIVYLHFYLSMYTCLKFLSHKSCSTGYPCTCLFVCMCKHYTYMWNYWIPEYLKILLDSAKLLLKVTVPISTPICLGSTYFSMVSHNI